MTKTLQKRQWIACSLLFAITLSMSGCIRPPKAGTPAYYSKGLTQGGGKEIISVTPKKRGPFKTVEVNGAELLEARGDVGQFGGTFYSSSIGEGPKTFNPWASFDATSTELAGMMFPGLVIVDAYTGDTIPYMAKDVKISPDKLTYTVQLRKGLQWSDGKPVTADDVVFTWNDIVGAGLGNASNRDVNLVAGKFPEVRKIDDLTVEFKTAKPFAPFIRNLSTSVAPKHILKPVVAKGSKAFSSFWSVSDAASTPQKFISSGMWLLESYDPRLKATFKRNPKFFMVDKKGRHLPYLDRYVYTFVGDLNNQELQFEQGKLDSYSVPGNFVSHVRKLNKPEFNLYNLGPTPGTLFLAINLNQRKNAQGKAIVDPIKSKWFNDVNFRQAINHTINRNDMVSNILKGVGAPLFTSESLSSIYLNKKLAGGFQPNVDYAKDLLKKSGFTWNPKGQLMDSAGHPVEFTLLTNSGNTEREAVGVNIKQDLEALGMKVNFKPIEFNVLVGRLGEGSWETMVMGLTGSNLEPHGGTNVWTSGGSIHLFNQRQITPGKPVNLSDILPWEKELDRLFDEGAQTFDFAKRKAIYDQTQQIIYDEVPLIYLYSPLGIIAVKDRIRNFDPTPLESLHNLEELWIKEK